MSKFHELIQAGSLFDSHCHLNYEGYDADRDEVVKRSVEKGVGHIVDIAVGLGSSHKSIEISKINPEVSSCIGIDPEIFIPGSDLEDKNFDFEQMSEIDKLVGENLDRVSMIGETGLDLYWLKKRNIQENEIQKCLENQKELFRQHIQLADKYKLPLSIHSREAIDECLKVWNEMHNDSQEKRIFGVFHSLTPHLTDDEETFYRRVKEIIENGFIVGLNGIITYKTATVLRNVVVKCIKEFMVDKGRDSHLKPIDFYNAGFVFETDGPFLAPEGKRGERNEPANVKDIFEFCVSFLRRQESI